jgi:hypothetical protein
MEGIAHHAQHPVVLQLRRRGGPPAARPDDHIVSQAAKPHHHLLRFKTLFAAEAFAQSLLVTLERGLHSAPTLIIERDTSPQHRHRIVDLGGLLPGQAQHLVVTQSRDQHPDGPLPIRLSAAHGNAFDRTDILGGFLGDPAEPLAPAPADHPPRSRHVSARR